MNVKGVHVRAAPTESRKGSQTPLVRVTGTYNLPMWVLGAVCILNHRANTPALVSKSI